MPPLPPSEPSAQSPETPDPLLHAVFGVNLKVVGEIIFKGEPFKDLRVVGTKASHQTSYEVDRLLDTITTHFTPSVEHPAPGTFFWAHPELVRGPVWKPDHFDLAAVVTGQKPATFVVAQDIFSSPHGRELVRRAIENGLTTVSLAIVRPVPFLLVGREKNVQELAEALYEYKHTLKFADAHSLDHERLDKLHERIGRALGYPEAAIQRFLDRPTLGNYATGDREAPLLVRVATPIFNFCIDSYFGLMTILGHSRDLPPTN